MAGQGRALNRIERELFPASNCSKWNVDGRCSSPRWRGSGRVVSFAYRYVSLLFFYSIYKQSHITCTLLANLLS
jgi:hypothetical protein